MQKIKRTNVKVKQGILSSLSGTYNNLNFTKSGIIRKAKEINKK
jgi:hypothetical protein